MRKVCRKCKIERDEKAFGILRKAKDGLTAECKECRNARWKELDLLKQKTDPLHFHKRRVTAFKTVHGVNVTCDELDALVKFQKGLCAGCGRSRSTSGRDLHLDHDHKNGQIRGLLCHSCNLTLGHADDSVKILENLIDFVKHPPYWKMLEQETKAA